MTQEITYLTRKENLIKDYKNSIKSSLDGSSPIFIEYSKIITSPFGGEEEIIYRGNMLSLDYKIGYDLKKYNDDLELIVPEGKVRVLSWSFKITYKKGFDLQELFDSCRSGWPSGNISNSTTTTVPL